MKKFFIAALLTLSLAACGSKVPVLSGKMTTYSKKNYTVELPAECEEVSSELSDISAQYEGCSVAIVTVPLNQATVCSDKEEFSEVMESLGYNLSVKAYSKESPSGLDAYTAEYELEKTKITQVTYVDGDKAYIATYARPDDVGDETDKIFTEGLKAFRLLEE